jgi:hypothetical protein
MSATLDEGHTLCGIARKPASRAGSLRRQQSPRPREARPDDGGDQTARDHCLGALKRTKSEGPVALATGPPTLKGPRSDQTVKKVLEMGSGVTPVLTSLVVSVRMMLE